MPCVLAVASSLAASPYPRVAFSEAALLSGEGAGPNVHVESVEQLRRLPTPQPTAKYAAPPTPSVISSQCGVSTSMSFCNASYPIVLGDVEWLQYVDAQAQYFYDTEQQKRSPLASSTCLAVMKSMVCSRYFPRCDPAAKTPEGEPKTLLPCQSTCAWLHEHECPGAEYNDCSLVNCGGDEAAKHRCYSSDECTLFEASSPSSDLRV